MTNLQTLIVKQQEEFKKLWGEEPKGSLKQLAGESIENLLFLSQTQLIEVVMGEVKKIKRDLLNRMGHEDYVDCETCSETLYHLEHVLSTIKDDITN